ncbi:MAG: 23S rRNA (adenine(2503)-C(2))-methyltransferase RlmN [Gammaproteobacteria bacterium]|nr:23S rRNA (adenine(2503)-C(2))-methyltransferase RlmN [Gammaproteobacteria bacterium]
MSSDSLNNADAPNLIGLDREQLETYFSACGEKSFRAQQFLKWVYQRGITNVDEMTDLSKSLRTLLKEKAQISFPQISSESVSDDGTIKWLLEVGADNGIEVVYIPEKNRATLCISSQVGCALDCTFCATARQGFNRNLTAAEIIGQVWVAQNRLNQLYDGERRITNVVFMGMGEPLLNFDSVVSTINILLDDFAYGLSKRRVTVSTSGVVPKIDRLSDEVDVSLAISLHAPTDETRNELVPLNQKYPIEVLLASCQRYLDQKNRKESITFEYVMLDGINDSVQDAQKLAKLLKPLRSKVNLIPFNSFEGSGYERSPQPVIDRFSQILMRAGLVVITRRPRGEDIAAACGQLAGQVRDKAHRQNHYVRLFERSKLSRRIDINTVKT